jgi:hypothetical protein
LAKLVEKIIWYIIRIFPSSPGFAGTDIPEGVERYATVQKP